MLKILSNIIAICYSTVSISQKSTDNFSGKWKTEEGLIIEITKSDASFNGKPIGKNVFVLKDLTFNNGKWLGVLTNPKKKITATCVAYLQGNKLKFIAKKGAFSKDIFWIKQN